MIPDSERCEWCEGYHPTLYICPVLPTLMREWDAEAQAKWDEQDTEQPAP